MRRIFVNAAALAATLLLPASSANAHPHVWITMRSDVVFNDKAQVAGIAIEWTFDDGYTQMALDGLDTNGDGVYSQSELDPLTQENLKSLKDYNYFVVPRVDGKVVAINDPTEYGQIYSNGKLELHFTVPLVTPVDPRKDIVREDLCLPDRVLRGGRANTAARKGHRAAVAQGPQMGMVQYTQVRVDQNLAAILGHGKQFDQRIGR